MKLFAMKRPSYLLLCNTATRIGDLLTPLKEETFRNFSGFWVRCIEMILLFLEFIRADPRVTGSYTRRLQQRSFLPFFNYSRWLPVYIMDMRHLEEKPLGVYNEFLTGNHTVSRSTTSPPFITKSGRTWHSNRALTLIVKLKVA